MRKQRGLDIQRFFLLTDTQAQQNQGTRRSQPGGKVLEPHSEVSCVEAIGLTFLTQHAVAEDKLLQQRLLMQQLAKGPAGVHRQALSSQVQSAPRKLMQLLQNSLLGLSPTLLA